MNPTPSFGRPSVSAPGTSAERPPSAASRTQRVVKSAPPIVGSNRAFVRAWAARRAKLAAVAKTPTTG
jgi:hypothetical protein